MNDTTISIIIGVCSGMIASAVGLIIRSIWLNSIKPAFENAVYKDIKIEGKWIGSYKRDGNHAVNEYLLSLTRKSHGISGTLIGTKGGDEGRVFTLKGSFRNLILTSTFESTNDVCLERGCLNLMVKNNGKSLSGVFTNYFDSAHEVSARDITFSRSENV